MTDPWPAELRLKDKGRTLFVRFENEGEYSLSAEYLRVMSPSAEVQGHSPRDRVTVGGKRNCAVVEIEPVGSYGVRLGFDDLHTTGIFTWGYLHDLGANFSDHWSFYEAELKEKGLDRDRPGQA